MPCDKIWEAAEQVWKNLESAKIARGYVLANRIAELVIKHNGDNSFLTTKELHTGVRKDFYNTDTWAETH